MIDIINSAIFYNQFSRIFSQNEYYYNFEGKKTKNSGKIILKGVLLENYLHKITNEFDNLTSHKAGGLFAHDRLFADSYFSCGKH